MSQMFSLIPGKFGGGFFMFLHGLEIHHVSGNSLGESICLLELSLVDRGATLTTPIQQFGGFLQLKQI